MKKMTLLAATALVSLTAAAQVSVGLERPKTDGAYDAFTTTDAFVKSADGLTVNFYESTEMAAKRTTTNTTTLYRQGAAVQSDFAWNLTCAMASDDNAWFGANDHPANDKFAEHFTFGFKLSVPEGKQFSVNAVELDLLVSANPTWRVRILNGEEELYNSGNMNKYNGFRNNLSVGNYALITATEFSMTYPEDDANASNAADQVTAALAAGFQLLPADLTLAAGDYTVVLDFDYNTLGSNKPMSFDTFTVDGELTEVAPAGGVATIGLVRPKTDGAYDAFTTTDAFVKSADGLTVNFYESTEMAAKRTTTNTTTLYRQGAAVQSDFAWNLTCAMASDDNAWFGANDHPANDKFAEHFTFGFKLSVPEGKQFSVNAVELDLLVSANPTWRVRILNGEEELYNSGNMNKYNGFRNNLSVGNYALITATEFSMTYPEDDANASNADDQVIAALAAGFQLLPADFTLAAGDYTVVLDFDYNTLGSNKPMSFDTFTIEGKLSDASTEDDGTITSPKSWNFSDWTAGTFTETFSKEGLTVAATEENNVTINANNRTVDGVTYTQRLVLAGAGAADYRNLSFNAPGSTTLKIEVVLMSGGNDANLNVAAGEFDNVVGTIPATSKAQKLSFTYKTDAPTTIYLYSEEGTINIYAVNVTLVDTAVGIDDIRTDSQQNAVYNLRGQQVAAPVKGQLYIVNGKKYIMR